jgi:BlaI family penicillinase repressor
MKLSEAEWQIMNALWMSHPATAREVMTCLPGDVQWAYTTVKTMLSRLVAKEAVSEEKRGNTSVYAPLISQQKARRGAFKSFLNRVFDGSVEPMLHFMVEDRELSKKQRQELIKILEQESAEEET